MGAGEEYTSLFTGLSQVQGGSKWGLGVSEVLGARSSSFGFRCNKGEMKRMPSFGLPFLRSLGLGCLS